IEELRTHAPDALLLPANTNPSEDVTVSPPSLRGNARRPAVPSIYERTQISARRHRWPRFRRPLRGESAGEGARGRHSHRPPQLSPLPAPALSGWHRLALAREHRRAAALDPARSKERPRPPRRSEGLRPREPRRHPRKRRTRPLRLPDRRDRLDPPLLR